MECFICKEEIKSGYFNESEEGMTYICIDCLLRFDIIRKRHKKYDCLSIYRMHQQNYSDRTIATYFGTNPLIIGGIVKDIERNLLNS